MTPANDNAPRPVWFDAMLMQHQRTIQKHVAAMEKNVDAQEDMVQRVFMLALEKWPKFRRDGNFGAWLWYLTKSVRNVHVTQSVNYKKVRDARPMTTAPTQEDAMFISEVASLLPPLRAETVIMSGLGFTHAEIANRQGVTTQAVIMRAKKSRAILAAANDNNPPAKSRKVA